jgi:hypothetical protein
MSNKKKLTNEDILTRFYETHGDKYDYSKVNYINIDTPVIIIDKDGFEYNQTPYNHLKKSALGFQSVIDKTAYLIFKLKKVHGDRYDYSKVKHYSSSQKITIICPEHGEFQQTYSDHLNGKGCKKCGIKNTTEKLSNTTEYFISKSKEKHGDKYDYSKVKYIKSSDKVTIICPEHGEFQQRASKHLRGQGCIKCGIKTTSDKLSSTIDYFISKSKEKHGDKYDYSKVKYVNNSTNVTIICPEHGEFQQRAANHLRGDGCIICGYETTSEKKTNTTEYFISKSKEKHGDKYDYSKVKYVNNSTNVTIICPEHGEFQQKSATHLFGGGCPKCGIIKRAESICRGKDEFIRQAMEKHGDKYDYSKIKKYKTIKDFGIIIDENGFEHKQRLETHLLCDELTIQSAINKTEYFISKSKEKHGDKYDYSKVKYIKNKVKVSIICSKHGEFKQDCSSHLSGTGCAECSYEINADKCRKTIDKFILDSEKVHGDKYDYSKVKYVNNNTKVTIICPKHGEFKQVPNSHIKGKCGCPKCKESIGERTTRLFLEDKNIEYTPQKKFKECKIIRPLPFDFYLPELNICIEYNGIQHYEPSPIFGGIKGFERVVKSDGIKKEFCKKEGIKLITIKYDEDVKKILTKELVKDFPNDMDLGREVRKLLSEMKEIQKEIIIDMSNFGNIDDDN